MRYLSAPLSSDCQISVVIPCLREQDIIETTLLHFLKIAPAHLNISIIVVTTEKESYEKQANLANKQALVKDLMRNVDISVLINKYNTILPTSNLKALQIFCKHNPDKTVSAVEEAIHIAPSTFEIVQRFIKRLHLEDRLHIIHYPHNNGYMADQLNFLLGNLEELLPSPIPKEKRYICVYNADSMPDKETFRDTLKCIHLNKNPVIMQQYSIMISNVNALSPIMKGFAMYQSNFELRNGLMNSFMRSQLLRNHVVGHGMFVRLDKLLEMGGFQTDFWCEDIYMSFYLRHENIFVCALPSLELAETPNYLRTQVKQHAVWFRTAFQFTSIYNSIVEKSGRRTLSGFLFWLNQIRGTLSWLFFPFCVVLSFIYSICATNVIALTSALAAYIFMIACTYTYPLKIAYMHGMNKPKRISLLFSTAFAFLLSNLGPIYSLINLQLKKHKTAR